MVRLHGHVPQAELWRHFVQADLFVFMARGEGLGMVVGEAMLLGCAPVVTDFGPMKELIDDGTSGVLAAPKVAVVAEVLAELVGDRARSCPTTRRCSRRGPSELLRPWEDTQQRFADELEVLVGQRPRVSR